MFAKKPAAGGGGAGRNSQQTTPPGKLEREREAAQRAALETQQQITQMEQNLRRFGVNSSDSSAVRVPGEPAANMQVTANYLREIRKRKEENKRVLREQELLQYLVQKESAEGDEAEREKGTATGVLSLLMAQRNLLLQQRTAAMEDLQVALDDQVLKKLRQRQQQADQQRRSEEFWDADTRFSKECAANRAALTGLNALPKSAAGPPTATATQDGVPATLSWKVAAGKIEGQQSLSVTPLTGSVVRTNPLASVMGENRQRLTAMESGVSPCCTPVKEQETDGVVNAESRCGATGMKAVPALEAEGRVAKVTILQDTMGGCDEGEVSQLLQRMGEMGYRQSLEEARLMVQHLVLKIAQHSKTAHERQLETVRRTAPFASCATTAGDLAAEGESPVLCEWIGLLPPAGCFVYGDDLSGISLLADAHLVKAAIESGLLRHGSPPSCHVHEDDVLKSDAVEGDPQKHMLHSVSHESGALKFVAVTPQSLMEIAAQELASVQGKPGAGGQAAVVGQQTLGLGADDDKAKGGGPKSKGGMASSRKSRTKGAEEDTSERLEVALTEVLARFLVDIHAANVEIISGVGREAYVSGHSQLRTLLLVAFPETAEFFRDLRVAVERVANELTRGSREEAIGAGGVGATMAFPAAPAATGNTRGNRQGNPRRQSAVARNTTYRGSIDQMVSAKNAEALTHLAAGVAVTSDPSSSALEQVLHADATIRKLGPMPPLLVAGVLLVYDGVEYQSRLREQQCTAACLCCPPEAPAPGIPAGANTFRASPALPLPVHGGGSMSYNRLGPSTSTAGFTMSNSSVTTAGSSLSAAVVPRGYMEPLVHSSAPATNATAHGLASGACAIHAHPLFRPTQTQDPTAAPSNPPQRAMPWSSTQLHHHLVARQQAQHSWLLRWTEAVERSTSLWNAKRKLGKGDDAANATSTRPQLPGGPGGGVAVPLAITAGQTEFGAASNGALPPVASGPQETKGGRKPLKKGGTNPPLRRQNSVGVSPVAPGAVSAAALAAPGGTRNGADSEHSAGNSNGTAEGLAAAASAARLLSFPGTVFLFTTLDVSSTSQEVESTLSSLMMSSGGGVDSARPTSSVKNSHDTAAAQATQFDARGSDQVQHAVERDVAGAVSGVLPETRETIAPPRVVACATLLRQLLQVAIGAPKKWDDTTVVRGQLCEPLTLADSHIPLTAIDQLLRLHAQHCGQMESALRLASIAVEHSLVGGDDTAEDVEQAGIGARGVYGSSLGMAPSSTSNGTLPQRLRQACAPEIAVLESRVEESALVHSVLGNALRLVQTATFAGGPQLTNSTSYADIHDSLRQVQHSLAQMCFVDGLGALIRVQARALHSAMMAAIQRVGHTLLKLFEAMRAWGTDSAAASTRRKIAQPQQSQSVGMEDKHSDLKGRKEGRFNHEITASGLSVACGDSQPAESEASGADSAPKRGGGASGSFRRRQSAYTPPPQQQGGVSVGALTMPSPRDMKLRRKSAYHNADYARSAKSATVPDATPLPAVPMFSEPAASPPNGGAGESDRGVKELASGLELITRIANSVSIPTGEQLADALGVCREYMIRNPDYDPPLTHVLRPFAESLLRVAQEIFQQAADDSTGGSREGDDAHCGLGHSATCAHVEKPVKESFSRHFTDLIVPILGDFAPRDLTQMEMPPQKPTQCGGAVLDSALLHARCVRRLYLTTCRCAWNYATRMFYTVLVVPPGTEFPPVIRPQTIEDLLLIPLASDRNAPWEVLENRADICGSAGRSLVGPEVMPGVSVASEEGTGTLSAQVESVFAVAEDGRNGLDVVRDTQLELALLSFSMYGRKRLNRQQFIHCILHQQVSMLFPFEGAAPHPRGSECGASDVAFNTLLVLPELVVSPSVAAAKVARAGIAEMGVARPLSLDAIKSLFASAISIPTLTARSESDTTLLCPAFLAALLLGYVQAGSAEEAGGCKARESTLVELRRFVSSAVPVAVIVEGESGVASSAADASEDSSTCNESRLRAWMNAEWWALSGDATPTKVWSAARIRDCVHAPSACVAASDSRLCPARCLGSLRAGQASTGIGALTCTGQAHVIRCRRLLFFALSCKYEMAHAQLQFHAAPHLRDVLRVLCASTTSSTVTVALERYFHALSAMHQSRLRRRSLSKSSSGGLLLPLAVDDVIAYLGADECCERTERSEFELGPHMGGIATETAPQLYQAVGPNSSTGLPLRDELRLLCAVGAVTADVACRSPPRSADSPNNFLESPKGKDAMSTDLNPLSYALLSSSHCNQFVYPRLIVRSTL